MTFPMALTAELVARCQRAESDPGPEPEYSYFTDEEYDTAAAALVQRKPPGPLWIFAYGSLIWKPAFAAVEHRRATAFGWHRAFCLELTRWRGSPHQPGLMLGLQRGGCCRGLAYRLPDEDHAGQLGRLLRREVGGDEEMHTVRWIVVETEQGRLPALTFWADPTGLDYSVRLPLARVAQILARACGHIGSGAEYLFQTVSKLEEFGIRDRNLWRLQQLVADEISSMTSPVRAISDDSASSISAPESPVPSLPQ
jgi:glutathione-specific gamma-glutamylcyclotransferase